MKVTLTKNGASAVICDGAEFAGQHGKFIPASGTGKTHLSRGMKMMPVPGRQPFIRPDDDGSMTILTALTVTVEFATEGEAAEFRMGFPSTIPFDGFGMAIQLSDKTLTYDDVSIQSLAIEQANASCTLNYQIKARPEASAPPA